MEVVGQLHAPATLPPGKESWYPLDRRLGGPQGRCGRGYVQKNSQPSPELEPLIIQPIAEHTYPGPLQIQNIVLSIKLL
jgi:hypothetical protein